MKSLSLFNQPVTGAYNKQGGLIFLEYVIIAFMITFAITCAMWWLYWHLQQMMWELKERLLEYGYYTRRCEMKVHHTPFGREQPRPHDMHPPHPPRSTAVVR